MLRIIAITGAPGVGKTETALALIHYSSPNSVLIDTDKLIGIHPFIINEAFYDLLYANLNACMANFVEWGATCIIISGVITVEGLYNKLTPLMDQYDWVFYGLQSEESIIRQRILEDSKGQDVSGRLEWLHVNTDILKIPKIRAINTTTITIEETAKLIAIQEGFLEDIHGY